MVHALLEFILCMISHPESNHQIVSQNWAQVCSYFRLCSAGEYWDCNSTPFTLGLHPAKFILTSPTLVVRIADEFPFFSFV